MTAQGTVSTDAAQDGVAEVVNNKMRTVRYCKDKMGTVSAAQLAYIELGPEKPMDTIFVVLGGKLVVDGTPCIVYGPNAREQAASLQERHSALATWQKTEMAVYNTGETDMVSKGSRTEFTCSVLYSVLLQPKKFIRHPPYMVVNYPWRTSMFRRWYELLVPSMNVPTHPAQPMLLVFHASCRSAQQILRTASALLVYSLRWTICFWDCTGLPPKSMQKVLSEEVTTTQTHCRLTLKVSCRCLPM